MDAHVGIKIAFSFSGMRLTILAAFIFLLAYSNQSHAACGADLAQMYASKSQTQSLEDYIRGHRLYSGIYRINVGNIMVMNRGFRGESETFESFLHQAGGETLGAVGYLAEVNPSNGLVILRSYLALKANAGADFDPMTAMTQVVWRLAIDQGYSIKNKSQDSYLPVEVPFVEEALSKFGSRS